MPKRILLLTFFYPPDLSAGSFRSKALVDALIKADGDLQVDVLTTQPNRYRGHRPASPSIETAPQLYVRRLRLPKRRGGFIGQATAFWRYARRVHTLTAGQEYDLVVATSSRLMTAVLGAWVARRTKAVLYLDIRDIFVENLSVLFRAALAKPLSWFFGALERWAISSAARVNLVSEGFVGYFKQRYPKRVWSLFSNGVDDTFLDIAPSATAPEQGGLLQVVYAGNVGDGQGLEHLLPVLAERLQGQVCFTVVGAGGRLPELKLALAQVSAEVRVLEPVPREQLLALYEQADVLFLHLNDYPSFRRVLPSKLFEYAATGKPIWAGVAGYPAAFLREHVANVAVFEPCDLDGAIQALSGLDMTDVDRQDFIARFARTRIMDEMAEDILSLVKPQC